MYKRRNTEIRDLVKQYYIEVNVTKLILFRTTFITQST